MNWTNHLLKRKGTLSIAGLILAASLSSASGVHPCGKAFQTKTTTAAEIYQAIQAKINAEYESESEKIWIVRGASKSHLQFGFESEYTLNKYGVKLLDHYRPHDRFHFPAEVWKQLQDDGSELGGRMNWLLRHIEEVYPYKTAAGLVLSTVDPQMAFLPESLILDETNNLEIILPPVDFYEQWRDQVDHINSQIGRGSMQATVSIGSQVFFSSAQSPQLGRSADLGFLLFFSDLDALSKLRAGFERLQSRADQELAKAFQHPFLGPMTQSKFNLLESTYDRLTQGAIHDSSELQYVSAKDDSFKYLGTTVFRPDLGFDQGRIVFEIRDAHSDAQVLKDRLQRTMYYLTHSRAPFAEVFLKVRPFVRRHSFERMPPDIQQLLFKLYPNPALNNANRYSPREFEALQVAKNFSFPLRYWEDYLRLAGAPQKAFRDLQHARASYIHQMEKLAHLYKKGMISIKKARVSTQLELIKFFDQFPIEKTMLEWWQGVFERRQLLQHLSD